MAETTIPFLGKATVKVVKWKAKKGMQVGIGTILATFLNEDSDNLEKLKCNVVGTVLEILVPEGSCAKPGCDLLRLQACAHPTVMKDMCAECGADLRQLEGEKKKKETKGATVAMVHSIPELVVSEKEALTIGQEDVERLLKTRKLTLLVDLDQTLIHTTNENIPPNLKDVYHFQLWHGRGKIWYHTKFRPGIEKFLDDMSKHFELHICSFGVRLYAHTIARFLDPDGKYFSHRILSRDECFDPTSKTANLKALFPCGDSMVCIIDDREDVWTFIPNLIHVRPYVFFDGTADINAPPGADGQKNDENNRQRKCKLVRVQRKSLTPEREGSQQLQRDTTKAEANKENKSENDTAADERDPKKEDADKENKTKKDTAADERDPKKEEADKENKTEKDTAADERDPKKEEADKENISENDTAADRRDPKKEEAGKENKTENDTATDEKDPQKDTPVAEDVAEDAEKDDQDKDDRGSIDENTKDEEDMEVEQTPSGEIMPENCSSDAGIEETSKVSSGGEKSISKVSSSGEKYVSSQFSPGGEVAAVKTNNEKSPDERDSSEIKSVPAEKELEEGELAKSPENSDGEEFEEVLEWEDNDDYLLYLADILTRIHTAFYEVYDQAKGKSDAKKPDLKNIIPYVRSKILQGKNIVFSGVFPLNANPKHCKPYQLAVAMGASVQTDIVPKDQGKDKQATTHLVAAKLGTSKVHVARKMKHIKVVTPDWLFSCAERWELVDERIFMLRGDKFDKRSCDSPFSSQAKSKRKHTSEKPKRKNKSRDEAAMEISERRLSDTISPLAGFSSDEIADMDKEVEEIFDESDSSDSDTELRKKVLKPRDSSSEDSLSGEYPKGWSRKRKRASNASAEDEDEDKEDKLGDGEVGEDTSQDHPYRVFRHSSSSSDSDNASEKSGDSIGSMDEEMIAAVEKEFLA